MTFEIHTKLPSAELAANKNLGQTNLDFTVGNIIALSLEGKQTAQRTRSEARGHHRQSTNQ
jgi:hypothetical protein